MTDAKASPASSVRQRIIERFPSLAHNSEMWRRALRWGATRMPDFFVEGSPPLFGLAFAIALPKVRDKIRENLHGLGLRGTRAEIFAVFSQYAHAITEAFLMGSSNNARLVARIVGDPNYKKARACGKGLIIATAHTSGWYLAGPILQSVYDEDDVIAVMQAEADRDAERVSQQSRDQLGMRIVTVGSDPLAAMPLLTHLRKGGVVALQIDRVPDGQRAVEVTLAGQPFKVPEGPLTLAALSQAPILVILGRRMGYLEYEMEVGDFIVLPRRPDREQLLIAANALAGQIEDYVRRHPTDWFHW